MIDYPFYNKDTGYWSRKEYCKYSENNEIFLRHEVKDKIMSKKKKNKFDIDFLEYLGFDSDGNYLNDDFFESDFFPIHIDKNLYNEKRIKLKELESLYLNHTTNDNLIFNFFTCIPIMYDKQILKNGMNAKKLIKELKELFLGIITHEDLASKIFTYIDTGLTQSTILTYIKSDI